jgi:hypothetical protein
VERTKDGLWLFMLFGLANKGRLRLPFFHRIWGHESMKPIIGSLAVLFAALAFSSTAFRAADAPGLGALKFLEGKWVGEGSSEVGRGGGYASFEEDLQGKAIVRRNHAEYPATQDRPVYKHDDLMVIYVHPGAKSLRAFYTDSEGHVIQYAVSVSGDGLAVTFLADREAGTQQYRLTYTRLEENKMTILLEAREADEDAKFQKVVEGRMQRVLATK